jgi:hypothetical protein
MAVINEHAITKLIPTKKNTVISLIMASFILAIANSSNLQFADAQKSSDEPNIEFIEQFGTSGGDDARGFFVDSSGGVYVVGIVGGEFPGQTNEGGEFDAFIRKYNADGDEEWTRQFGTSEFDTAIEVSGDSSGGVYVVGNTNGEFPGQTNVGGSDSFIRKYNSDGDEEWTRQFGTSGGVSATGVSADSSGGVYVVGFTFGTFPDQTNEGGQDAFLAKFATDDEDKKKHDGDNHDKKKHNDHYVEKKH